MSQENGQNTNGFKKSSGGRSWVKLIIAIVIIIAAVFGVRHYMAQNQAKQQAAQQAAAPKEQLVVMAQVEEKELSNITEYVGNIEAIQSVSVVPQVAGEIMSVNFREGSQVKAGQVLFVIDKRQYEAAVALRKAEIEQAKANLTNAERYYARVKAADKRSVTASDVDTAEANVLTARAALSSAQASLRLAEIDLGHATITSPINGRIGKALITKGNYVTPSTGALATIVQTDPVRVSFAVPDRDYIDQIKLFNEKGDVLKTTITLSNGDKVEVSGKRDFENNQIDTQTGTMTLRLLYDNTDGKLVPGSMVRVSTQPVKIEIRKLIPQEAMQTGINGDYVYVVKADSTVEQRGITVGKEYGTDIEVVEGLETGETIVKTGAQLIRQGQKVRAITKQNTAGTSSDEEAQPEEEVKPAEEASGVEKK